MLKDDFASLRLPDKLREDVTRGREKLKEKDDEHLLSSAGFPLKPTWPGAPKEHGRKLQTFKLGPVAILTSEFSDLILQGFLLF